MARKLARGVEAFGKKGRECVRISWMAKGGRRRETIGKEHKEGDLDRLLQRALRLRQRYIVKAEEGWAPTSRKLYVPALCALLEADYATHHRKATLRLARLLDHFAGVRVADIDHAALTRFVVAQQQDGLADGSIGLLLANLHTAFGLAKRAKLVADVPDFPALAVKNNVSCFFTVAEQDRLLKLLRRSAPGLAAAVEFAALTGWRQANVFYLTWEHVSFETGKVTAPAGTTKNDAPITTPFAVESPLNRLLRRQHRITGGTGRVFRIERGWRTAWAAAVGERGLDKWGTKQDPREASGVKQVRPRFHDLRHTFAQRMTDAGVSEGTIQDSGGWKTRAAFERYFIKTDRAKRDAQEQRDAYVAREREAAKRAPRIVDLNARRKAASGK